MIELNKIYCEDCRATMARMPGDFVNCIVTSPPYWGLRDYGVDGQFGLEKTPEEYIAQMVEIFREARRVLRDDGVLWLNLGDSYSSQAGNDATKATESGMKTGRTGKSEVLFKGGNNKPPAGLKPKDLVGIPWRVAFALQADGWYLRQDIIWSKPNPMPESVKDRCTKAHEYIFLLTKSARYWYDADAIREPLKDSSISRLSQNIEGQAGSFRIPGKTNGAMKAVSRKTDKQRGHGRKHAGFNDRWDAMSKEEQSANGANKRSVWEIATKPFSEAHFATFPPEIPETCIKAGCPEGGIVYDPFMGAGTVALVARLLNRNFIGSELNPEYVAIAEKRIKPYMQQVTIFDVLREAKG